jgi:hypothetical protein
MAASSVREGDAIEVAPNDDRIIKSFELTDNTFFGSGNNDGHRSPFNNRGQWAFQALFNGGSNGIFVSDFVAVPEPTSLIFGALFFVWFRELRCPPRWRILFRDCR